MCSCSRRRTVRAGALKALDAKALKLTGEPIASAASEPFDLWRADRRRQSRLFLTYRTNAMQAVREVPTARIVAVPDALAVGADYGLETLNNAPIGTQRLAVFILSPPAQAILARHGFAPGMAS